MRVANWAPLLERVAASSPRIYGRSNQGRWWLQLHERGIEKKGPLVVTVGGVDVAELLSVCYYCDRGSGLGEEWCHPIGRGGGMWWAKAKKTRRRIQCNQR